MVAYRTEKPRRPTRRDAQREATRRRLLDAARELFSEYGYDAVSVTEIAKAAGVQHSLINAYFHAKAGLLYELVQENNAEQIERSMTAVTAKGDVLARLRKLIDIWIKSDLADPRLLAVMEGYFWQWPAETEEHNRRQLDAALEVAREILRNGVEAGELKADLDVGRWVEAFFAIYTLGLRPAVYDGATTKACLDEILRKVELMLEGARVEA